MKTVTLRIPEASYRRLVGICRLYGVTMRGVFEATTVVCMKDMEDPARRDDTIQLWEAARALEESSAFRQQPIRRVNAKFDDDELVKRFAATCRQFGVSQNAALGLAVTAPWPVPDTEHYRRSRQENWRRIIELAREMEFARRPYAEV